MPPENQNFVSSSPTPAPVPAKAGMHWLLKVFLFLVILGVLGVAAVGVGGYFLLKNSGLGDIVGIGGSSAIDEKMPWGIPDGKYVYKNTSAGQEDGAKVFEGQGGQTIIISGRQKLTTTKNDSTFLGGAQSEIFKYEQLSAGGQISGVECEKTKVTLAQAITGKEETKYDCEAIGPSRTSFRPGKGFMGADKPETIAGVSCLCADHGQFKGCHAKDYPELTCRVSLGFSPGGQNKVEGFNELTEARFGSQTIDLFSLPAFTDGATQSINIGRRPLLPGEDLSFPALNYFIFSEEEFTIDLNKNLLAFSLFFFKPYNEEFTASIVASAADNLNLNSPRTFSELISKKFSVNQDAFTEKDFSLELSGGDIKALEDFAKKHKNQNMVYFYLKVCAKDKCTFNTKPVLLKGDGKYRSDFGRMFDILRGDS